MLIKYVFNALVLLMTLIGLCVKSLQANSNISCVNHSVDIVAQSDPNNNHTDTIKLYRGRGRWRCGMGGGGRGAARPLYTHHDNASRLLHGAHAHNGSHANGGALEVDPAAKERRKTRSRRKMKNVVRYDLKEKV